MTSILKFFQKFHSSFPGVILFFFLICLLGFVNRSSAQDQHIIDSLQKILPSITTDSIKIEVLNNLSQEVVDMDPAKSINYAKEALQLAEKLKIRKAEAQSLHNIGNGNYNLAEYKVALSFYIKALNIQNSIGNKKGILSSSGAIGNVFLDLKQPDQAYKYFRQSLSISRELNNKGGIASSLIAIGTVFSDKEDYILALDYCFQSLKIFEEIDNKEAVATCYNNIADSYHKMKNYPKAMFYINNAYEKYNEIGNVYGMALALNNLGNFYQTTGNQEEALKYFERGLAQAKKIGANDRILAAYEGISKAYKKLGRFKDALAINELYQQMNDSIYNIESSKQIAEMQARFDTEKKAKEIDILTKDKKLKDEELLKQRLISWSMAIGGCLLLLLALLAIRGYIQKRKVNDELAIKNKKIENAYNIIENQHKDIKDSIKYAQRLQEAILPTVAFSNTFPDNAFVFYKPKDIVSGDFYWIEEIEIENNKHILFAAVDCTGHGVPGAFMSIVGHNLLNQAVNEHHKVKPSDILNEINIGLSETLRQKEEEASVKDGMDIALCCLNKNANSNSYTLQFSGANNPLWVVRANPKRELIEIKGDKFPIGIYVGEEFHKFYNHELELFPGDTLYIFTDGFADQFGGHKGKKFKYKPLQQLVLSMQDKTMKEQQAILNQTLAEWKGNLEQVDDILMIGIRV